MPVLSSPLAAYGNPEVVFPQYLRHRLDGVELCAEGDVRFQSNIAEFLRVGSVGEERFKPLGFNPFTPTKESFLTVSDWDSQVHGHRDRSDPVFLGIEIWVCHQSGRYKDNIQIVGSCRSRHCGRVDRRSHVNRWRTIACDEAARTGGRGEDGPAPLDAFQLPRTVPQIKPWRRQPAPFSYQEGVGILLARGEGLFNLLYGNDLGHTMMKEVGRRGAGAQGIHDDGNTLILNGIGASWRALDEMTFHAFQTFGCWGSIGLRRLRRLESVDVGTV